MASEQELIESQDKRIAALKTMLDETRQQLAQAHYLYGRQIGANQEMRALLEEAMRAIVGAASPEIPDEIARMEFWRVWGERVRVYLRTHPKEQSDGK